MKPSNALAEVRRLAAREECCEFFKPVLETLRGNGLDTDDLREILQSELGELHCYDSKPTERYYPQTMSDYYKVWIDVCRARMFLKLLVVDCGTGGARLVITSFKKDDQYDG